MPQHPPALAVRAAVACSATVLALAAVMPGPTTPAAGPVAAPAVARPYVPTARIAPPAGVSTSMPATTLATSVTGAAATIAVPSARSASALSKAMGKIGSPYRWGAAGPTAFDCSGLVSWAYKQVGVGLPRSSNAMSKVGTPVSRAQLRPGDLVFFYRPVSHVAMYVGGGKVVHASTSSQPVKVSDLADMPFTGARRI